VTASDVGKLDPKQPKAILIVGDTVTVDPAVLKKVVDFGHAVISIGNTEAVRNSLSEPGPILSHGDKVNENEIASVEKAFAKMNVGRAQSVFGTQNSDLGEAVLDAVKWAKGNWTKAKENPEQVSAQAGSSWQNVINRTYSLPAGDAGVLNIFTTYDKLTPSPDGKYDYYMVKMNNQSVPYNGHSTKIVGASISPSFGAELNNDWQLQQYGPTTTVGSSSATVSVGLNASDKLTGAFNKTWAYSTQDVTVVDNSNNSLDIASWRHEFNGGLAATSTFLTQPGATVRVPINTPLPMTLWNETYTIKFSNGASRWVFWGNRWDIAYSERKIENLWSKTVGTPKTLNIWGGAIQNAKAILYDYGTQPDAIWRFEPQISFPGYYQIRNRNGYCLAEVWSGPDGNNRWYAGTHCEAYASRWGIFSITADYPGYAQIKNKWTGRCLGTNGHTTSLSLVQAVTCAAGGSQQDQLWGFGYP
jgi:hypothetical protein